MKNILETLKGLPNCSKFLSLIRRSKLESIFSGSRPITVFVPSNKGCDCLEDVKDIGKNSQKIVN